ncbi:hypothetical protein FBU30_011143 [Linnemannia zychae]|nr:hypothetical protein FBU30_011143 [Linnemannia zychae]
MDTQKDEAIAATVLSINKTVDQTNTFSHGSTIFNSNLDIQDPIHTAMPIRNTERHNSATNEDNRHMEKASSANEDIESYLPSEILIVVFGHLSIPSLLVCQKVSHNFRAISRAVMLDKLGRQAMTGRRNCRQHCAQCQQSRIWDQSATVISRIGVSQHGSNGLPPLPYHHLVNNPNTILPVISTSVEHHNSYQLSQDSPQHQLHHHLYQHQSTEDMSQHHQTDLHIHHHSHRYHVPPQSLSQSAQQSYSNNSSPQQFFTTSCVAFGIITLFLFPYHNHTPTRWQDRQSVHFVCTEIDRSNERLVFSPIYPDVGDFIEFNTNSWNLPSAFSSTPFGEGPTSFNTPSVVSVSQDIRAQITDNLNTSNLVSEKNDGFSSTSRSGITNHTDSPASPSLIDLTAGRSRFSTVGKANIESHKSTSYSFSNQFNKTSNHRSFYIASSSGSPSSYSSSASSSSSSTSLSSLSSTSPKLSLSSTMTSSIPPTPSWASINGHGGDQYSVIGIKYSDWPEDRQSAGRWWGGGLHSSMSQESMIYMPWMGTSNGFNMFNNRTEDTSMEITSPALTMNPCIKNHSHVTTETVDRCKKIHKHHMYHSTGAHPSPPHHHRYLCLHHDQLMTDIANYTSSTASDSDSKTKRFNKMPITTTGSKHFEVDYRAHITESKRCLFCLSTPCKANLEIQIKFEQLRVSLDWILSGFRPEQNISKPHGMTNSNRSAIADAIALGSASQGQVPS